MAEQKWERYENSEREDVREAWAEAWEWVRASRIASTWDSEEAYVVAMDVAGVVLGIEDCVECEDEFYEEADRVYEAMHSLF